MHQSKYVLSLLAALAGALVAGESHATTFTTLTEFSAPTGSLPDSPLTAIGSTLYGATQFGGNGWTNGWSGNGTLYSLSVTGGAPTTLTEFNGTNGSQPTGNLTLSADGSTFYGTTEQGGNGTHGAYGTVFSVPVTGGNPTTLTSFSGTNGAFPFTGVILSGSTLYGAAGNNGDYGVVYRLPVSGGTPTVLATMNGTTTGNGPSGGVTLVGSTLYGTTEYGGANGAGPGMVFSVPASGGTISPIVSFNTTDGAEPLCSLTLVGSTFYGTTLAGGANNDGTVFSVPVTGGIPTTLATFDGANGASPYHDGLLLIGSTLYGTTANGGDYGDGTVFSVPVTGGSPTTLFSFNGADGATPYWGLTNIGSTLYGTTTYGGQNWTGTDTGYGTVFALALVPEPSSFVLLGFGALGLGAMAIRRRIRKQAAGVCRRA